MHDIKVAVAMCILFECLKMHQKICENARNASYDGCSGVEQKKQWMQEESCRRPLAALNIVH